MRMTDPIPQFTHFVSSLKAAHPELAYLHAIEALVNGSEDAQPSNVSNDFLREIWGRKPFINAGGYNRESAIARSDVGEGLVSFGRHFIANVRLPFGLGQSSV
jgi:NADPH2 dehydrogenase